MPSSALKLRIAEIIINDDKCETAFVSAVYPAREAEIVCDYVIADANAWRWPCIGGVFSERDEAGEINLA